MVSQVCVRVVSVCTLYGFVLYFTSVSLLKGSRVFLCFSYNFIFVAVYGLGPATLLRCGETGQCYISTLRFITEKGEVGISYRYSLCHA